MSIDTRARDAARVAHDEIAAVVVPSAGAVVARRRARSHARLALASAAILVVAVGAGAAVAATRDSSSPQIAVSPSPPPTVPRAGLSFMGFHARECPFQGVDGCTPVPDEGTSSDVASASVRAIGGLGSVIDVTLTPAAAERFANDSIVTAYIDGVQINAARGPSGTLVLSQDAVVLWNAARAEALATRIRETR